MTSQPEQLRDRTKAFAFERDVGFTGRCLVPTDTQVLGKQLLRCGTSVAANYRAVVPSDDREAEFAGARSE